MSRIDPRTIRDSHNVQYRLQQEGVEVSQPAFEGVTHSANSARKSLVIGELAALELGVHPTITAESKVWSQWNPATVQINGTNGVQLLTISNILLTAVR